MRSAIVKSLCFFIFLIFHYFCHASIDVVIICHPKDKRSLDLAIEGIRNNGTNIRRIIVVSSEKLTENAEFYHEENYPFSKMDILKIIFDNNQEEIATYLKNPKNRAGWIYQQLLKLYAPLVIPDISSDVLILDADTIFLRKVEFIDRDGYALYNIGTEYHKPYFDHAKRLIREFPLPFAQRHSGITHHMLFQREVIDDFFMAIKETHGLEPWQALCKCIDKKCLLISSLSEYELYFNFAFSRDYKVKIRRLKYAEMRFSWEAVDACARQGFDYVSCHTWKG